MSYTNISQLNELIGKNVLFFDLETTGVIKTKALIKPENKFPIYTSNIYDDARIVSFGYSAINNFDYSNIYKYIDIYANEQLIKPDNFVITNDNIHGITQENALNNGISIKDFFEQLSTIIINVDYIIGYNVYFDVNILLSELYRYGFTKQIDKINNLKTNKKILCIGIMSSKYLKPDNWIKKFNYHIPKQIEVYKKCYNEYPNFPHNSKYDVIALIKITDYIYNNIYLKKTNVGKKWTNDEIKLLLQEIKDDVPIEIISNNHKRNIKGILYAINKFNYKNLII
jgi:DNA polymerase III epsilon subunit-like protein